MEEFEQSPASQKTKSIHVSTVISITLVLVMAGLLGLLLVHAKSLSDYIKQNIVLNVIIHDDAKDADIIAFQKQVEANPAVLKALLIDKEQAASNLTRDLGEDFVQFLGYNPLLPSIDIYLKAEYANNENMRVFSSTLSKNPLVKEIVYQKSLIDVVDKNIREISLIILSFAAVLLIIAVTLINNTIRLAVYSQRFLIKSMQLVGATKAFIRKPFMENGVLHGFLAGIIAILLLLLALYVIQQQIPEISVLANWSQFMMVFAADIGLGILISVLSTYFAVRKYLRTGIHDLYR